MHGRIADMDAERSKPMLSGLLFCLLSLFPVTTRDDRLALAAPCTCAATPTRSCYVPRERHPHAFREMCLEMRAHFRRRPHAHAMAGRQPAEPHAFSAKVASAHQSARALSRTRRRRPSASARLAKEGKALSHPVCCCAWLDALAVARARN